MEGTGDSEVPLALPEAGPLPCSVTLSRFLNLPETQFPPLQEGAALGTARSPPHPAACILLALCPLGGHCCTLSAIGGGELILD